MDEPTFDERMRLIAALLDDATPAPWRSVPDSRPDINAKLPDSPMVYTEASRQWTALDDASYGGYFGTGELINAMHLRFSEDSVRENKRYNEPDENARLASFSKYFAACADAFLIAELRNAADEIIAMYKQYQMIVAELRQMTPARLHDNPEAMIKWLRRPLDY